MSFCDNNNRGVQKNVTMTGVSSKVVVNVSLSSAISSTEDLKCSNGQHKKNNIVGGVLDQVSIDTTADVEPISHLTVPESASQPFSWY